MGESALLLCDPGFKFTVLFHKTNFIPVYFIGRFLPGVIHIQERYRHIKADGGNGIPVPCLKELLKAERRFCLLCRIFENNGKVPFSIRFMDDGHIFQLAAGPDRYVHGEPDRVCNLGQTDPVPFETDVVFTEVRCICIPAAVFLFITGFSLVPGKIVTPGFFQVQLHI